MNRTDRLLAIVLELQAHGSRRAEDLAASFEVSKRTIYRDVQALCEAGVPVVAEAGRGYSLPAGYFLPPLRFSANEALMLLLGADAMTKSFDAEFRGAASDAARKIMGALPAERRDEVRALQESLHFVELLELAPRVSELLLTLRRAVLAGQTVRFAYRARFGADDSAALRLRDADPYGLARVSGVWYLVAFCHLRGAVRNFRLERISSLELLPAHFSRPPGFVIERPRQERAITARVLVDADAAPWVREGPTYFVSRFEDQPDGSVVLTMQMRRMDEALPWLLGWGRHLTVLEPPELRELILAEARGMLAAHDSLLT
jgi:predicted DNA-binding transcriptional regulator YafY